ncbi:MAG: hypothetical protein D6731_02855 [Planctomycetota bacterium]|nr:MAG: hypothetical protein D6731_02855 [Planctomycetota bacterium]
MAEARSSGRWTSLFRRRGGEDPDAFVSKFLGAVARIFEGGDPSETFRNIRSELGRAFDCDEVALFAYDPLVRPGPNDGDWVLVGRGGSFAEGKRVSQTDGRSHPHLQVGIPVEHSERTAREATLKAIALAFQEDTFYGCDVEQGKVLLLRNPRPEDDMGSGDLSVLAIPLHYRSRAGRLVEKTRVGVLVLFNTPVRRELADLERVLRSLVANALVTPTCMLRDPVTGLYSEAFLREEIRRQTGLFELTKGKIRGGFVLGMIDTLKLYKQTIEASGRVDPTEVSERVSDVLRGVASCVLRRAGEHHLGMGAEYRAGVAGRVGREAFGVVLPLLSEQELLMWAVRCSKDVIDHHFESEELLAAGDITVSLRVVPFQRGTPAQLWRLSRKALEELELAQQRARRDPEALSKVVSTIRIWKFGRWMTTREFQSALAP